MELDTLYGIIIWAIVPGVMIAMFLLGGLMTAGLKDADNKLSARAGFWAGLIVFVVYVINKLSTLPASALNFDWRPDFDFLYVLMGAAVGFVFLMIVSVLRSTKGVGIVTLILSAASSLALFNYFFDADMRNTVMFFSLGALFGVLMFVVIFPQRLRALRQ